MQGTLKAGNYIGRLQTELATGDLITRKGQIYYKYSPNGTLLQTYSSKPLELGIVKEQIVSSGKYRTTVTFDDRQYVIVDSGNHDKFKRDENKYLYSIDRLKVRKYSSCGKLMGQVSMPSGVVFREKNASGREPEVFVHEAYGEPVLDIHGNIYVWKKSPKKYSILKWTWVDDPNVPTGPDAPMNLAVSAAVNGLYLTWTASPQDPGCVTGYEVYRATSAGGVGSTVATVTAGVLKYTDTTASAGTTYYYKIRAVSGTDYSPYTVEVSGKR